MNHDDFYQSAPQLKNTFTSDPQLGRVLRHFMGKEFAAVEGQCRELGERAATDMWASAREAEVNPPRLVQFDPWGKRIDQIQVSPAWTKMEKLAAEFGIVATGYERKQGPLSRVLQMGLLYLYHPSSALFSCPLAMTDGAARALEVYGGTSENAAAMKSAFQHLTSRDPSQFWTSGQWMTEKTGGSDVGLSLTTARKVGDHFELHGTKWFTSATTSQMAMTLARPEGAPSGGKGLSLFFVHTTNAAGELQKIRIHRLKDKLGTKALPTAELGLEGTPAWLVGGEGQGIKKIATLFNVTRIYNAACSIASMQRGLQLATDYAKKRHAFGRTLSAHALHLETLADLYTDKATATLLVFKTAELWGKEDCGQASAEESALLRILTTLAKLSTAKSAVRVASEVLESFGGAGYIEDTGLPALLRDAQVFPIWEGTTNVLSLDILRALGKDSPFSLFQADVEKRLQSIASANGQQAAHQIRGELNRISEWLKAHQGQDELLAWNARKLAFAMTQIYMQSLAVEFAQKTAHPWDQEVARRSLEITGFFPRESTQRPGLETLFADEKN